MSTADPLLAAAERLTRELRAATTNVAATAAAAQDVVARAGAAMADLADGSAARATAAELLRDSIASLLQALAGPTATTPVCETQEHHHAALVVELWKQTVSVQQHFNDLELRIRNFAITVFVAVIGATAFAFKENLRLTFGTYSGSLGGGLLLAGILSWFAFYFMDRWWYHPLLLAAVYHGGSLENELAEHFRNAKLGVRISQESPIRYGFSVAVAIATVASAALVALAPSTLRGVLAFLVFTAGLIYAKHVSSLRALRKVHPADMSAARRLVERWLFIDTIFFVLCVAAVAAWFVLLPPFVVLIVGSVMVFLILQHERADAWAMHSSQKVDVFYLAGFLLYVGIFFGIEHATRGTPAEASVTTVTRTQTSTQANATSTFGDQTSTSRSTTKP
jgi:hypothetical protein